MAISLYITYYNLFLGNFPRMYTFVRSYEVGAPHFEYGCIQDVFLSTINTLSCR